MKSLKKILLGATVLFAGIFSVSCEKDNLGKPVEPKLEIQELVEVEAAGGITEIPLVSSYPWIASSNADWFKFKKNRGQMKLKEKIVIEVNPNPSSESREAGIQIRLMDQMSANIIIRQKGK